MSLQDAFLSQAQSCESLGSPFMGRLLRVLARDWDQATSDTVLAAKCADFTGDIGPSGHSLPLRVASGLHALVLQDIDAPLCAAYPPHAPSEPAFAQAVLAALRTHDAFLCDWITNAPQTNEVRRSAVLKATAHLLRDHFDLPLMLSELGASAGLNLMFDQFHMDLDDRRFGPATLPATPVHLSPDWSGPLPPNTPLDVTNRRGVDLNPLNSKDAGDVLKLQAYLWADQSDRLTRTRAAITLQNAPVDRADAIDWLHTRLQTPHPGALHLIYSTVAWQYFPPTAQSRGTALIEAAGAQATKSAPVAWLSYEADAQSPGAGLTLRLWPGDLRIDLGRADFHGRWVQWAPPSDLTPR